jgi:2-polyprenyl-3-methyl-5-hydroxy-6-metoxy-1,4-benzoquinol methylase
MPGVSFLDSSKMSDISLVVADVLQKKSQVSLKFENGSYYDSEMQYAYHRTVAEVNSLGNNLEVIEFGCFTGIVSASLQRLGHHVTASDINFVLEDEQNSAFLISEGVKLWPHNLAVLPLTLPSNTFDIIVFTEVIEHLNFNPIPLLCEFSRILKPGGLVYCATPNLASLSNRLRLMRGLGIMNPIDHLVWNLTPETGMSVGLHWREWTKSELVALFVEAGFVLKSHHYGLIVPNKSKPLRKYMVKLMYDLFPSFMPNQVSIFAKDASKKVK